MPQGFAGRRKRLRQDSTEVNVDLPSSPMNEELPQWVKKTMDRTLQSISNIERAVYKKEIAISKLEEHRDSNTCPNSLKMSLKVMVTEEKQPAMDTIVNAAVDMCQKTIVNGLIEIRQQELTTLRSDQTRLAEEWNATTKETLTQMKEANILQGDPETILTNFKNSFQALGEKHLQAVKVNCFLQQKKQMEAKDKFEKKTAAAQVDEVLHDPHMSALQDQIKSLQKSVKQLSKNDKVKPSNQGGGPSTKKDKGKKNQPKPQGPRNGKTNPPTGRNKGVQGNGNKNPKSPARRSTNQSASKPKNSQKKRN